MISFKQFLSEDYGEKLAKKHGVKLHLSDRENTIHLHNIIVPKEKRNQGVGTAVMQDINNYADKNNKTVTLQTAVKDDFHGTTSQSRLKRFYKRHGYVENKGRNKDFSLSGNMYRPPIQKEETDWVKKANKSSIKRKVGGKFGMPVVHKAAERLYDEGTVKPKDAAHDFGSGKYNTERNYHREKGRNWTGHDIGDNVTKDHDQGELKKKGHKKLITMGNVVNTLPDKDIMHTVIGQAKGMLHKDGHLIVNHPKEPRYHNLSNSDVEGVLKDHFHKVEKTPESRSGAPVWHAREPKN
jgi:hypothetical protein